MKNFLVLTTLGLLLFGMFPAVPTQAASGQRASPTPRDCRICAQEIGVDEYAAAQLASPTPEPTAASPAEETVVRLVMFWMEGCPHCHEVLDTVLPPLQQQFGSQLEIALVEVVTVEQVDLLIEAAKTSGIPTDQVSVPFLVIGDQVLIGSQDIPEKLPGLIEQHLSAGGIDYPEIVGLEAAVSFPQTVPTIAPKPLASPTPPTEPTIPPINPSSNPNSCDLCNTGRPIWAVYFYADGCAQADEDVNRLLAQYVQIIVEKYPLEAHASLAENLAEKAGLTSVSAPMFFVADQALIGVEEVNLENMKALIRPLLTKGSTRTWISEVSLAPVQPASSQTGEAEEDSSRITGFWRYGALGTGLLVAISALLALGPISRRLSRAAGSPPATIQWAIAGMLVTFLVFLIWYLFLK